jgi:hypothetical protein
MVEWLMPLLILFVARDISDECEDLDLDRRIKFQGNPIVWAKLWRRSPDALTRRRLFESRIAPGANAAGEIAHQTTLTRRGLGFIVASKKVERLMRMWSSRRTPEWHAARLQVPVCSHHVIDLVPHERVAHPDARRKKMRGPVNRLTSQRICRFGKLLSADLAEIPHFSLHHGLLSQKAMNTNRNNSTIDRQ